MDPKALSAYLVSIQKKCLPGTWSKGVSLVRELKVKRLRTLDDEIQFQVMRSDRPVAVKVSLYIEDEDYVCDCDEKASPCSHIAACVAALKSGQLDLESAAKVGSAASDKSALGGIGSASVYYHFVLKPSGLQLNRQVKSGSTIYEIGNGSEFKSLTSLVGAQKAGRISIPDINATQDDFKIDQWISHKKTSIYESEDYKFILKHLEDSETVTLDSVTCKIESRSPKLVIAITDENNGFRLKMESLNPSPEMNLGAENVNIGLKGLKAIADGMIFWGDHAKVQLCRTDWPKEEFEYWASGNGEWISSEKSADFVVNRLPKLKKIFKIDIRTQLFPEVFECDPRLVLDLNPISDTEVVACVHLVYGDNIERDPLKIPLRSVQKEHLLKVRCQSEFFLGIDDPRRMKKTEAARLRQKWNEVFEVDESPKQYAIKGELLPNVDFIDGRLEVSFQCNDGSKAGNRVGFEQVFKAYREGESLVPLFSGQNEAFSKIPMGFLQKFAERLRALLLMQDRKSVLPPIHQLDLKELMVDMGFRPPQMIEDLSLKLQNVDQLPTSILPDDFTANLRPYQMDGFRWLCFLKSIKCGALLADDMGLGKTVQSIAVLKSKSLVIVPTSVLESWVNQIRQFRPSLRIHTYYGPNRVWPENGSEYDVMITSFALLRNDSERFLSEVWNTVIVDEAQNIKNPDSQLARVVHQLKGEFKLALTGTPIENRVDDLWSIFEFINAGYLGARSEFRQQLQSNINKRIRPFTLRRLKADVAKDLPPKIESVLKCEMTSDERSITDTIFASTKKEILKLIESNGSVFSALEVLLRLRQASTDVALLGQEVLSSFGKSGVDSGLLQSTSTSSLSPLATSSVTSSSGSSSTGAVPHSSKTRLLIEQLDQAIENGHRCLVFSQWTSYLDRIENAVTERGFQYVRLDGTTKNRGEVIRRFQSDDGPPLFLISLKAGGVGLTLTKADHVYLMDPWWNPAVEEQAMDRTHRIGQENTVFVYRVISEGTIEENILKLSTVKKDIAKAVFDVTDESALLTGRNDHIAITTEDLKAIFDLK